MIKSSCDNCGDFRATPASVTSWIDEYGAPLWAVLNCPSCSKVIVRAGNDALTSVLDALGSPQRVLSTPVESVDEEAGRAAPFTPADINTFRDLLDSDEGFIRELGR